MQHYMDDIHDLLDGLNGEMKKRMERMGKWDDHITRYAEEIRIIEEFVCNTSIPLEQRECKLHRLAELKGLQRNLAERKTELAERNQMTVRAVYAKLNELAYHCKCEVEIDNPGCTEKREKLFLLSLQSYEHNHDEPEASSLIPSTKYTCEFSSMTDDDRNSTRSGTPFHREIKKKARTGPGRPRNAQKHSSAYSSTRSSVEHDSGKNVKKLSKYMLKKQEAEERAKMMSMDIKKEFEVGDFDALGSGQWGASEGKNEIIAENVEEDEQELLNCLFMADIGDIGSPPKGMLEALDVNETGLYGMDMYPPDQNSVDKTCSTESMSSNTFNFQSPCTNYPSISKKTTAATSSSSGEMVEKRKRNMLFGSIADTSFSGRPRKLTDRVTEMIQSNREKEIRQKMKRESEEWCFCNGENTKSDMMVGCDNSDCRIVWFHFDCVGLTKDPQNEWYCPECRILLEKHDPSKLSST